MTWYFPLCGVEATFGYFPSYIAKFLQEHYFGAPTEMQGFYDFAPDWCFCMQIRFWA